MMVASAQQHFVDPLYGDGWLASDLIQLGSSAAAASSHAATFRMPFGLVERLLPIGRCVHRLCVKIAFINVYEYEPHEFRHSLDTSYIKTLTIFLLLDWRPSKIFMKFECQNTEQHQKISSKIYKSSSCCFTIFFMYISLFVLSFSNS
jgi:hypothetical protein